MDIISGKECKTFINKFIKMINGVNKYNVESILLVQMYSDEKGFEPVIESKPMELDIFEYLKTIYSDNEIVNRSLTYMDMSKIKKKIDKLYYAPIIFSSQTSIPFIKLTVDDISNHPKMILPSNYSNNINYSNSYFIVTDLFKNFIKDHEKEISAIDSEFHIYDNDNYQYDTSAFIYKNEINENFESKIVESTSPKRFLPLFIDEENESKFINDEIKELLIKLNIAVVNRELKDIMILEPEIGLVSTEEALNEMNENIKFGQPFYLKDDSGLKSILTFNEFFKINPKEVLFITKDFNENNSKITYAGLALKTKDFVLYLFYKYFDYGEK